MAEPDGLRPGSGATALPAAVEMAARHAAVRAEMERGSLDGLLVFGNLASAHPIRWLTRWPPGWDAFLLFPAAGTPRLLVPSENHVPTAEILAGSLAEVAWVGVDPGHGVLAAVREMLGRTGGRLGLVGPVPYTVHARLASEPGIQLSESDGHFRSVRMIKRQEEIERTRRAAALADAAVERLLDELRPGLRDYQIGAILQGAYREAGGDDGICFLASASMRDGGSVVPGQVLSDRAVAKGDIVLLELSVGVGGDTSQVLRTMTLGPATAEVRRLHDIADQTFDAVRDHIRPGASAADLLEQAGMIDDAGLTVVDDVVHGYGGGYLPPVLRTPKTQRRAPPDLRLEPGMMLVVQPNVVDLARSIGVQTGELLVVTPDGAATFHSLPRGVLER